MDLQATITSKAYKFRTTEWRFKDASKEFPEIHFDGRKKIGSPEDAYLMLKDFFEHQAREYFGVLWLNTANKVLGFEIISIGNINSSVVHPREVFRGAVVAGATSLNPHPQSSIRQYRTIK